MERGKLIVLEGIDGSGKSTHAHLLCERLRRSGVPCEHTFEPTDHEIGQLLRRYLKGELHTCERTIASLFVADRLDHITREKDGLLAWLNAGTSVVCDRYYYSSLAYNCISEDMQWVAQLNLAAKQLLQPDLVVYLDLPVSSLEQRLINRGFKEIYETAEYQREVSRRYNEAFAMWDDNVVRVACNRGRQEVQEDIWRAVKALYR